MTHELRVEDIAEQRKTSVFHEKFASFFHTPTRDASAHALEYYGEQRLVSGLESPEKRGSIEPKLRSVLR